MIYLMVLIIYYQFQYFFIYLVKVKYIWLIEKQKQHLFWDRLFWS